VLHGLVWIGLVCVGIGVGFWFRSVVERSIAKPDDDAAVGFCLRHL
jgi:hypothetical protein